jgi:type II secretory pathway predicted ATPase ExeA
MDPNANPFNPGAGTPPPELVGRDPILQQANTVLERIKRGRSERSLLFVGLRGVGKTVLLREVRRCALDKVYVVEMIEAQEEQTIAQLLVPALRRLLLDLDDAKKTITSVKRGLRVLRSFLGTVKVKAGNVEVTLGVDPEAGRADSGDLESDLKDMLIALGEAARDAERPIALLIDELQYLPKRDLAALIRSLHAVAQEGLPLVLFGAGLPQLFSQVGEAKSYAERLFRFFEIDRLSHADSNEVVRGPVQEEGASVTEDALEEIYKQTKGYPYFLQEWGYRAWNLAPENRIDVEVAREATLLSMRELDHQFFRVRFDRVTPGEREYMRALAELGESVHRSGEVADLIGKTTNQLGPVRDALIRKGMVYSPAHGDIAFTVPLFDQFMKRTMPMPTKSQRPRLRGPNR